MSLGITFRHAEQMTKFPSRLTGPVSLLQIGHAEVETGGGPVRIQFPDLFQQGDALIRPPLTDQGHTQRLPAGQERTIVQTGALPAGQNQQADHRNPKCCHTDPSPRPDHLP